MLDLQKKNLIKKIEKKNAIVGIIGLGYVGLPLLLRCCEVGYNVVGFDINDEKIALLSKGKSYIEHIPDARIKSCLSEHSKYKSSGTFESTCDFSRATETDILIVCVPTPLNKYRDPDLCFITNTIDSLLPYLRAGQMLCLASTTYPGTTDEELAPRIASLGLKIGEDFFLAFSPEREDPGNTTFTTSTIPRVCGGFSSACLDVGVSFYNQIVEKVVPVSSTRVAEFTKILENIHRAVNIGLINEMKIVADKMGIDIHEAIRAAATKPFGFTPYQPGPGLGGHCLPIDPFYLTWKAREFSIPTRFIELAGEINASMPDYVISKVISALNKNQKSVSQSRILILGLAYKKNVDDIRESPSVIIMEKLQGLGASISYSDPHIPSLPQDYSGLSSMELSPDRLIQYDCVLLTTDHDKFDYSMIKKYSKLIIDCRGRYTDTTNFIIKA